MCTKWIFLLEELFKNSTIRPKATTSNTNIAHVYTYNFHSENKIQNEKRVLIFYYNYLSDYFIMYLILMIRKNDKLLSRYRKTRE